MSNTHSFSISRRSHGSATYRVRRVYRYYRLRIPPPPPSTPQSSHSDHLGNDTDQRGDPPPRALFSNPMFPLFRPLQPPGYGPVPRFFVYRPDGTAVPMIALDELPSWIRIGVENWQDAQWVRYMVPASMYGFPRMGEYVVTFDPVNSNDTSLRLRNDNNADTDSEVGETLYRDPPCQDPPPLPADDGSVSSTTTTANVVGSPDEDVVSSDSMQSQFGGRTVIHHNREAGSSADESGVSSASTVSVFDTQLGVVAESPPTSHLPMGPQRGYPIPTGLAPLGTSTSVPQEQREGVERERFTIGQRSQSFPAL